MNGDNLNIESMPSSAVSHWCFFQPNQAATNTIWRDFDLIGAHPFEIDGLKPRPRSLSENHRESTFKSPCGSTKPTLYYDSTGGEVLEVKPREAASIEIEEEPEKQMELNEEEIEYLLEVTEDDESEQWEIFHELNV